MGLQLVAGTQRVVAVEHLAEPEAEMEDAEDDGDGEGPPEPAPE